MLICEELVATVIKLHRKCTTNPIFCKLIHLLHSSSYIPVLNNCAQNDQPMAAVTNC